MGFGLHIMDFGSANQKTTQALVDEFGDNTDMVCKSQPRQHLYKTLTEFSCIPIFQPIPVLCNSEKDINLTQFITNGIVTYSPGPDVLPSAEGVILLGREVNAGRAGQRGMDYVEEYLLMIRYVLDLDCNFKDVVISPFEENSAQEVCEGPTSAGLDFPLTKERLCVVCCTRTQHLRMESQVTQCFELNTLEIQERQQRVGRAESDSSFSCTSLCTRDT